MSLITALNPDTLEIIKYNATDNESAMNVAKDIIAKGYIDVKIYT